MQPTQRSHVPMPMPVPMPRGLVTCGVEARAWAQQVVALKEPQRWASLQQDRDERRHARFSLATAVHSARRVDDLRGRHERDLAALKRIAAKLDGVACEVTREWIPYLESSVAADEGELRRLQAEIAMHAARLGIALPAAPGLAQRASVDVALPPRVEEASPVAELRDEFRALLNAADGFDVVESTLAGEPAQ